MPDFLAGQRLTALHFTPTVGDVQAGSFTFTITTFGVATTGGTYVDCGVAFMAPSTERVAINFAARLLNNTSGSHTRLAPVVRTGSVVGSGASIVAASIENMIDSQAVNNSGFERIGATLLVEGLNPGDTYNVRLEHAVTANTGTIQSRSVFVSPTT